VTTDTSVAYKSVIDFHVGIGPLAVIVAVVVIAGILLLDRRRRNRY
jgi:hypothetical protein